MFAPRVLARREFPRAREGSPMFPRMLVRRAGHHAAPRFRHGPGPCAEPLESRCLLNAGDLDTSFNGTGQATVDFGSGNIAFSVAPAVQTDGKTVVAGYAVG